MQEATPDQPSEDNRMSEDRRSVNIAMVQDVNNAMVLMSWEAFSLARPGCSIAEYLISSGRNSL